MNTRKLGSFALCALLLALCASAQAQQAKKIPRIGHLNTATYSAIAERIEAFRQGLHELVINLKTAKQIALTIPPNVLARADKVIK